MAGITLFYLISGKFPYKFKGEVELIEKISKGKINLEKIEDEEDFEFIECML